MTPTPWTNMNNGREIVKSKHLDLTAAGIFGAGVLTMYFVDPDRGKRRRAVLKDTMVHSGHDLQRFTRRFRSDCQHRIEGALAETHHLFDQVQEQVSDAVLEQRIRTALGRVVSHSGAIEVNCTEGLVFLGGWVLADELDDVNSAVRSVRGVKELSTFFNTTDHPEHISALQGGRRRSHGQSRRHAGPGSVPGAHCVADGHAGSHRGNAGGDPCEAPGS